VPRPRAIIAEDEPLLREELAELLGALWPELDIVAQTGDGIATLREVETHAPDVLFLDIQMPGLTGLDVARQLSGRCHIVFVTAYDQHTLAAFEEGAADYLLKPADAARLATTVARLKERVGRPRRRSKGCCASSARRGAAFCAGSTRRTVRRFASSPWTTCVISRPTASTRGWSPPRRNR